MANSPNYVSYQRAAEGSNNLDVRFTVTFSGSYTSGAGNGETVIITAAGNPNGLELNGSLPVNSTDSTYVDVTLWNFPGYHYLLTPYSLGSFTVRFYVASTGAELASGAYPAVVTAGQMSLAVRHRL